MKKRPLVLAVLLGVALPTLVVAGQSTATVSSVQFRGEPVGDKVVFSVEIRLRAIAGGLQAVPLLPADAAIVAAEALAGDVRLRRVSSGCEALLPGPGAYALRVGLAVPLLRQGKQASIRVPLPRAASHAIQLRVSGTDWSFETSPKSPIDVQTVGPDTSATIYPPAAAEITIRWLPKRLAEPLACVYSLDESSHLTVGPGALARNAVLHFAIARGKLTGLSFHLRADATVFEVKGEDVESWDCISTGTGKQVRVKLIKPQTGRYDLRLRSERPSPLPPTSVSVEPIRDPRAAHQRGYLAFMPSGEVSLREQARRNAAPFDVRTLDGDFVDVKFDTKLAYHYDSADAAVTLSVAATRPKRRVVSSTFVMLERGIATLASQFDYEVRDAGVYEFRLKLDKGMSVTAVKGKSIKDWTVDGPNLAVRVRHKVLGSYRVHVAAQQIFHKVNGIVIPRIEADDADEETGYIGVSAGLGVYLQHHAATKTRQVETAELPRWLQQLRPRLAYVYRSRGGGLSVSTVKVEPELTAQVYTYVDVDVERMRRETLAVCKIRRAGIFGLRLAVPQGLVVTDVQGPLIDDWSLSPGQGELRVSFTKEVKGAYHFQLYSEQWIKDLSNTSVQGVSIAGASKVEGWLAMGTQANLELRAASTQALTPSRLRAMPKVLRAYEGAALAYRFDERPWGLVLQAEQVTPRIEARTFSVLRFRQGNLAVRTEIHYDILKAGVSRFDVELPAQATNSEVEGADITSSELTGRTWRVDLDQRKRGAYLLNVKYDVVLPTDQGKIDYAGIRAVAANKQTGTVVACQEKADVAVAVEKVEALAATDLSPDERKRVGLPVIAAFHYALPERRIQFAVAGQRLSESMLQASMPDCHLYTLIKRDGLAINYLTGSIQNVKKQFLTVGLGEDADLWGTYIVDQQGGGSNVAGQPVKPSRLGPGRYTIPLLTSTRRARSVAVVWSEPLPRLGVARTLDLRTPKFDVPVQATKWHVLMPDDYQIASVGGNMDLKEQPWARASFLRSAWRFVMAGWAFAVPSASALLAWGGIVLLGVAVAWAVRRKRRLGYVFPDVVVGVPRLVSIFVVLVIIVVLAGMLLPSLSRAKQDARKAVSKSNLKQLGFAMQMYTNDYGECQSVPLPSLGGRTTFGVAQTDKAPEAARVAEGKEILHEVLESRVDVDVQEAAKKIQAGAEVRLKARALVERNAKRQRAENAKQAYNMALAYRRQGEYDEAEKKLKNALKLDSGLTQAKQELERLQAVQMVTKESLAQQQQARPQQPPAPARSAKDAKLRELLGRIGQSEDSEKLAGAGKRGRPAGAMGPQEGAMAVDKLVMRKGARPGAPMKVAFATGRAGERFHARGSRPSSARPRLSAGQRLQRTLAGKHLVATNQPMLAQVLGGKAQGALPIALEFPNVGTVAYEFEKAYTGDRSAELTIRCVRLGAALTLQGGIVVILSALLVGVGLKSPKAGLAASCVVGVLCLLISRLTTPAMQPYCQCAIAAAVVAAAIVAAEIGLASLRARENTLKQV